MKRTLTTAWTPIVLLVLCAGADAQPAVTNASGTWTHRGNVTITGSGFGSKATAAPVVWDDASGASINDKWDGAWPNNNPTYNLAYRPAQRGVGLPHNNITKYLAGAHGQGLGPQSGYAVMFFKNRNISYPSYTYVSWYQRADNAWVFGGDNNFKTFAVSSGTSPYESTPDHWYLAFNTPLPNSTTSGASYVFGYDVASGNTLRDPDANGHSHWWDQAVNPFSGVWTKVEMEIKYSNQNDGYIKLWENGALRVNYAGHTDSGAGTARSEGIGGYARNYNQPANWRYFADVYFDYSRARVILGNAPTLAASTRREVQIPTSWASSSIALSVNLGSFTDGQTAYLYVIDANGVSSAAGLPVTIGSAVPPTDTTPPTVTATTPAGGTTGVSTTTAVSATFSEAMNAASIAGISFTLRIGAGTPKPASVSYAAGTHIATLTPSTALTSGITYTATVIGGSGGVRDAAGNAMASNASWSFTTAAAPPPVDTTPPTVTVISPVNGATGVSVAALAIVTFSEAMNASTVSTSTLQLRNAANALVTATVNYDSVTRTATLTPSSVLASGAVYRVIVKGGGTGVKDVASNPLAADYSWTFTAGRPVAPTGLRVIKPGALIVRRGGSK